MLIPFLDPRDEAFPAGRPVVFVAGLVFFLAGVAILTPVLTRGRDASLAQGVVAASLISVFAAVPVLIALREGALPLLVSVGILGVLALVAWDHVLKRWIPRKTVRLWLYAGLLLVAAVGARLHPALGGKPVGLPAEAPAEAPVSEKR